MAAGGWFDVTVSVACALVALGGTALETMQRNWAPLSPLPTEAIV